MRRKFESAPSARLIVAAMWRPSFQEFVVRTELEKTWGKIVSSSGVFDFTHTEYYTPEMGQSLKKCFYELDGVHQRDSLVAHKYKATEIEDRYLLESGARQLNLDPMLLSLENLVIATSKIYSHRVYLRDGIYADLALVRRQGKYESFPWTYPDYVENLAFFEKVRERLKN